LFFLLLVIVVVIIVVSLLLGVGPVGPLPVSLEFCRAAVARLSRFTSKFVHVF